MVLFVCTSVIKLHCRLRIGRRLKTNRGTTLILGAFERGLHFGLLFNVARRREPLHVHWVDTNGGCSVSYCVMLIKKLGKQSKRDCC